MLHELIANPDETAARDFEAAPTPVGRLRSPRWHSRVLATLIGLLLPSTTRHVDAAKISALSLIITTWFLFTGLFSFPGGAGQFTTWAQAIVEGQKLDPSIAERDAGYPMLLVLSGWTVSHSFIGIAIIQAGFAVLMPLLVYWSIVRLSGAVAYYAGIASALSFAPVQFMKWIHHDQPYIFFMLVVVWLLAAYVQSRRVRYLYGFTAAAVVASFMRPAGNLLFPVLLVVSYLTVRGRLRHYAACALIVAGAAAGYSWYRYEIFDVAHQTSMPSYTGEQVFYDAYINSGDFGIRLSPEMGPAMRQVTQDLRRALEPDLEDSAYLRTFLSQESTDFATKAFLSYTPDELIQRIYDAPNWEYYLLLSSLDDDHLYLQASQEIARAHPLYVAAYTLRNLWHMLFDPGYAHIRYTANGNFQRIGLDFLPAGSNSGGIDQYPLGERATTELTYNALDDAPPPIQWAFTKSRRFWERTFDWFLYGTSFLMAAAWLGTLLRLVTLAGRRTTLANALDSPTMDATVATILAASAFLLYNALVTAAFAEPDYRYFLFTELLRILIAACGAIVLLRMVRVVRPRFASLPRKLECDLQRRIVSVRELDGLGRFRASRAALPTSVLVVLTGIAFAAWTGFMTNGFGSEPPMTDYVKGVRVQHQMTIDFSSGMRLVGWSSMPLQPDRAKGSMHLRLFWEAWETPDFDYSAFLHLTGPGGYVLSGKDHGPGTSVGLLPHLWPIGETITDDWTIEVPSNAPNGEYRLELGLYDYRDLKPVPTTSGRASLLIGSLALKGSKPK